MSDPNACPSCLHLRRALDALAYLGDLVPLPSYVEETTYYLAQLHGGHLASSHADSPPVSLLSTSADGETGVTGVREPVTKIHPSGLPHPD